MSSSGPGGRSRPPPLDLERVSVYLALAVLALTLPKAETGVLCRNLAPRTTQTNFRYRYCPQDKGTVTRAHHHNDETTAGCGMTPCVSNNHHPTTTAPHRQNKIGHELEAAKKTTVPSVEASQGKAGLLACRLSQAARRGWLSPRRPIHEPCGHRSPVVTQDKVCAGSSKKCIINSSAGPLFFSASLSSCLSDL